MRRLIALAMATALWSCAAKSLERHAGTCDAAKAQFLVGQPASGKLAAQARDLSGAVVVRWLSPGQIVTMEFRADRLSVVLDANNRVRAIRCG